MGALAQQFGVFSFQYIDHTGHGMDGIFPEVRRRTVRFALSGESPPEIAFVGGDGLRIVGSPAMARSPLGPAWANFRDPA